MPCYGLNCTLSSSQIYMLKPSLPLPQNVFRGRPFKEMMKLKWVLGWALLQSDWCSHDRRKLGPRNLDSRHVRTGKTMQRHWDGYDLQAKERGFRRNSTCQLLDPGLLASRTIRKLISPVEAIQSVIVCYGGPSKLITCPMLTALGKLDRPTHNGLKWQPSVSLIVYLGSITEKETWLLKSTGKHILSF